MDKNHNINFCYLNPKTIDTILNNQQIKWTTIEKENFHLPLCPNLKIQLKKLTIQGTVEEVSVGAMCELIKQLRQNKQPYEPFENQIYEQQLTINLGDQNLEKKVQPILQMIQTLKNPFRLKQGIISPERLSAPTKTEFLRSQFGTQKDGSLGTWGGKKYEGLGMRDQFTNYRKQVSKNFYQFNNPR